MSPEDKEVLQHIARPDLPWRASTRTRCGRQISELAADRVILLAEARTKVKRLGQQRAAMFLCMTCCNHTDDWPEWDQNPSGLMARTSAGGQWRSSAIDTELDLLDAELRVMALLIAANREDFDAAVQALLGDDMPSLSAARLAKGRQQWQS